jgi:hypothetical protein
LCSSTTTAPGMGASPGASPCSIIRLYRLADIRTSSGRSKSPCCHARTRLPRTYLFFWAMTHSSLVWHQKASWESSHHSESARNHLRRGPVQRNGRVGTEACIHLI